MPPGTRKRKAKPHPKPIRLFIADGHTLFREGLRRLIDGSHTGVVVVGEADNGREAVREVSRVRPDILILDLVLSGLNGMEVLRRIAPLGLQTLILAADIKEEDMRRAVQLKASAILPKESPFKELIRCIRSLGAGRTWTPTDKPVAATARLEPVAAGTPGTVTESSPPLLQQLRIHITKRESEIIGGIAAGSSNKEIARRLLISDRTVKNYLQNIFNKTRTSNRIELLHFAIQNHLVDDTSDRSQEVDSGPLGGAETA
jgi:DNA-binding NarL/FixJ family response regulator